jgi:hypothetical protein
MAVKTITVKGDPVRGERPADAAITPGHLIELISTNKVQKQAGDSTRFMAMFALENSLIGDEIDSMVYFDLVMRFMLGFLMVKMLL